MKFLKQYNT